MPKKLFITNDRMLRLMEWAIQTGKAEHESAYFEKIGFTRNNSHHLRQGNVSFTKEQILNACKITGASADYIFGFTNVMLRKRPDRNIDTLKQAVHAVELEMLGLSKK